MAIYIDEKDLIAAHNAGDSSAFEEIVREHRPALHRYANRLLLCEESAEDAVQETLVRAYRALPRFSGDYQLGPWLHRILKNVCIDEANRRKKDSEKTNRVAALPGSRQNAPSAEEELNLDFDDSRLKEAINGLSDPYREAFMMRFAEDMDYAEVASLVGVTEQNARARVSRARSFMKMTLKGVAVLPVFLIGLLKRSERAVAAFASGNVTSASSASAASTLSPGLMSSASVSSIAEVGVAVAPVAMPVIAKAAVGIGLAAAVFAPGSDSALHQAVDDMTTNMSVVAVSNQLAAESELETPLQVVSVESPEQSQSDDNVTPAAENVERLADGSIRSGSEVIVQYKSAGESYLDDAPTSVSDSDSIAIIETSAFSAANTGSGFYDLEGEMLISTHESKYEVRFNSDSQIRLFLESEIDGRMRVDVLLIGETVDNELIEFRLAGFARENSGNYQIAGLFRAESENIKIEKQGSFNGLFGLGSSLEPGSLAIKLVP